MQKACGRQARGVRRRDSRVQGEPPWEAREGGPSQGLLKSWLLTVMGSPRRCQERGDRDRSVLKSSWLPQRDGRKGVRLEARRPGRRSRTGLVKFNQGGGRK